MQKLIPDSAELKKVLPRDRLHEDEEVSWAEFLRDFIEEIYPTVFKPHGIDLNTAILLWKLQELEWSIVHAIERED